MPKIKLIRMPDLTLIPATPGDEDKIRKIAVGSVLEVEYRTPRNYKFHKRFFALLNLGFRHWEPGGGEISDRERSYLDGFAKFLALHVDHYETIDAFAQAYAAMIASKRDRGSRVAKSFEIFRKWVTVRAGWYEEFTLPDMTTVREPLSISFAQMDESEFQRLYSDVFEVLWNMVLERKFPTPEDADAAAMTILELSA